MNKKAGILLVIILITILSALILSAIFFDFGSEDLWKLLKLNNSQQQGQTGQTPNQTLQDNLTQQPLQNQTELPLRNTTSLSWCNLSKKEIISSDIFGEGTGLKLYLGTERIVIGNTSKTKPIMCEACHSITSYRDTKRVIDEWVNIDESCYKYLSSKTYLFTNKTNISSDEIDLIFSNKTLIKEKWYVDGTLCLVTNGFLKAGSTKC